MLIHPFLLTIAEEPNCYLVGCRETRRVMLVDAGETTDAVFRVIEQEKLIPIGIFLTHLHYDHINGVDGYVERWQCPVYAAKPIKGVSVTVVKEGDTLEIGRFSGRVFATPGHTGDSLSLLVGERVIFSGDALFAGSIGGTNSEQEKSELLGHIRRVFLSLPDEVEIHPGHGPLTTVAIERRFNPFLVAGA